MRSASPVHDWGTAPRPAPVSPFQYSANPDSMAPDTVVVRTTSAASVAQQMEEPPAGGVDE